MLQLRARESHKCRNMCIQMCVACEREYQGADGRNLFLVKTMIRHSPVWPELIVCHHLQQPYPELKFVMIFWMNARFLPTRHVSWRESTCVECTGMTPFAGQMHLVISFRRRKNTPQINTTKIKRGANTAKYSMVVLSHTKTSTQW